MKEKFWFFCYRWFSYSPRDRAYIWTVGPHPLWANRFSEWLHDKWMTAHEEN